MHEALYRKWRPLCFKDVVGQDAIIKTLRNQVAAKKPAHAYLFSGTRGTGKTTCSKILAQAVNCENTIEGDVCGKCDCCKEALRGAMTDIVEIDAASNNSVDDVRELREEAIFAPATGSYRVYIIDEAHMLSKNAFNALLKIMEEPPRHVIFILATTETHKIPPTVLSRCQRFDFKRYKPADIAGRILYISKEEGINLSDEAAFLIAQIADGGMRDAVSILDQCQALSKNVDEALVRSVVGATSLEKIEDFVSALMEENSVGALALLKFFYDEGVDFRFLCEEILKYFRDIMIIKSTKNFGEILSMSQREAAKKSEIAAKNSLSYIFLCIEEFSYLLSVLANEHSARATFEMAIIKITTLSTELGLPGISARLEKLEAGGVISKIPPPIVGVANLPAKQEPVKTAELEPQVEETHQVSDEEIPLEEENASPEERELGGADEEIAYEDDTPPFDIPDKPPLEEVYPEIEEDEAPPFDEGSLDVLREAPASEDIILVGEPFPKWGEVKDILAAKNPPLAATLAESSAYLKGDLVLIDAPNSVFLDLMRASDATKESLRGAIEAVMGGVYRLGPVKRGAKIKIEDNKDALDKMLKFAKDKGIEVKEN